MENKVIRLQKQQEGKYIPLEIQVEDIEKLEIHYSYNRYKEIVEDNQISVKENAVIDFSIIGPNEQFLGSSGSDREYLFFSELESSIGFEKLKQMAGVWTILIGAYKIPDGGIDVTYEFKTTEKRHRWFKGDTHMHTQASDGQLTSQTLVNVAKDMKLDFIILTDHNNYHPEASYLSDSQLTVIPGVEWTQYNGHGNFINIDAPLSSSFVTTSDEELREMINKGNDIGALFVINHPFCSNVPWKWTMELNYDAVEIINGGSDPRANLKAIEWWHQKLVNGNQVPVIGGSDFHRFDQFHSLGSPTTHIFSKSKSRSDILKAIKEGAVYITNNVNGPKIDMRASDGSYMGQTTHSGEDISITIRNLNKGNIVKVIDDKETQITRITENIKELQMNKTTKNRKFVRMEIWDGESIVSLKRIEGNLLLVSNPIYIQ